MSNKQSAGGRTFAEVATADELATCLGCHFYEPTALFDLCQHAKSEYKIGSNKPDWHTIGHMRSRGACTADAVLFKQAAA